MKKIFLIFVLFFWFFTTNISFWVDCWANPQAEWCPDFVWPPTPIEEGGDNSSAWCNYTENSSISSFLDDCKPKTVVWWSDMKVEWWFKTKLNNWITNISIVLWVMAVGALIYAALLFQFAMWEDEKIKKAKDIVKWTLIWFLLLISASWIIYTVINVMFWLWE